MTLLFRVTLSAALLRLKAPYDVFRNVIQCLADLLRMMRYCLWANLRCFYHSEAWLSFHIWLPCVLRLHSNDKKNELEMQMHLEELFFRNKTSSEQFVTLTWKLAIRIPYL